MNAARRRAARKAYGREAHGTEAGFTLVEMIVVMAVLGLVFAVVFAARPRSATLHVDSAARSMVAALRRARDDAMMGNVHTSVVIDRQARRFGRPETMAALPSDIAVTLTGAADQSRDGAAAITFYPDGRSSGGTLVIASGPARATIDIDWLTGLAKVRR